MNKFNTTIYRNVTDSTEDEDDDDTMSNSPMSNSQAMNMCKI